MMVRALAGAGAVVCTAAGAYHRNLLLVCAAIVLAVIAVYPRMIYY